MRMEALGPHDTRKMMTEEEARKRVISINSGMNNVRFLLLDFYEREGWRALGYESWRECVTAEFGQSKTHLYRQLEAAQIESRILQAEVTSLHNVAAPISQAEENKEESSFSPIGEKSESKIPCPPFPDEIEPEPIPESQLRPLASIPAEDQATVWQLAKETAPEGKVTAKHVEEVVREIKGEKPRKLFSISRTRLAPANPKGFTPDAMTLASLAIVTLEKIKETDPQRKPAIAKVATWCWEQRQK